MHRTLRSEFFFIGTWAVEELKEYAQDGDLGLVLKSKARHAAISAPLTKPFHFEDKPLIVQYEVNFQEGQECGGAYVKLLTLDENHVDLKQFNDKTPYTIMFGPDKCGNDHKVLKLIFLSAALIYTLTLRIIRDLYLLQS